MIQSPKDEMVVINSSNFYVCTTCGYTEVSKDFFAPKKDVLHKTDNGRNNCINKTLRKYSLGYRFTTSVLQIRFEDPCLPLNNWDYAYSVLQGIISGFCKYYSIDERDVSGCLQYFLNDKNGTSGYSIVLYDSTPGGSGYVRMLNTSDDLKAVLEKTYEIVSACSCGGEKGDASCYSCLRSYYNQKYHDNMKRSYVKEFIEKVLFL